MVDRGGLNTLRLLESFATFVDAALSHEDVTEILERWAVGRFRFGRLPVALEGLFLLPRVLESVAEMIPSFRRAGSCRRRPLEEFDRFREATSALQLERLVEQGSELQVAEWSRVAAVSMGFRRLQRRASDAVSASGDS
jgi:hypothetical protein